MTWSETWKYFVIIIWMCIRLDFLFADNSVNGNDRMKTKQKTINAITINKRVQSNLTPMSIPVLQNIRKKLKKQNKFNFKFDCLSLGNVN